MAKNFSCDYVRFDDGTIDVDGTVNSCRELIRQAAAAETADFDSVAVEIEAFLNENPNLKTITTTALVRELWEKRLTSGQLAGKSPAEKAAMYFRLGEVVPEYVKSSEAFHMGRKTGISIVERLSDEERAKLSAAKEAA